MLKSFEYIDPILAQKIHNLQSELKKIQFSRDEILNNPKLSQATRDKLLKYQDECAKNIEKMLDEQKNKLAEYLDEQTNAITKSNRLSTSRTGKHNVTLNQSTRIDFQTTDDSRSLNTTKTEINRKVSSFYMPATEKQQPPNFSKFPSKNYMKIKQLKKKVVNQQKLIKMLVTWVKIYYEREQTYKQTVDTDAYAENEHLKRENEKLRSKCKTLQNQINQIRQNFRDKTLSILHTQKKYDEIKYQNSALKIQRKQLLNNARSLTKPSQI